MEAGKFHPPPFFSWKFFAHCAVFITSAGWSFYLVQMVLLAISESFFDWEYYLTSRLGHVDFILIYATATSLVILRSFKKNMLGKNVSFILICMAVVLNLALRLTVMARTPPLV